MSDRVKRRKRHASYKEVHSESDHEAAPASPRAKYDSSDDEAVNKRRQRKFG